MMSDNVPVPDLASVISPGDITVGRTAQLISPSTTAELSDFLAACDAEGRTVIPTGAGTKLGWGNPVRADVHLSTARLTGVREHAWADLTATVGAGTPWAELQAVLAKNKQRVALDPFFASGATGRATVGGVLATNDSGALRARYGSLRDLVIGMTVVLADGTVARTGGKVVKNVAGYDLPKLLTGAFGTLGVITEATFRLHPLPAATAHVSVHGTDALALGELMKTLYAAHLSIERCQLVSKRLGNEAPSFVLEVELASLPEALEQQEQTLRKHAAAFDVENGGEEMWRTRDALFADPNATVLKVTSLPARLSALVTSFTQLGPNVSAQCIAEPSGIAFCSVAGASEPRENSTRPQPDPAAFLADLLDDLRARLRAHGGSAVVLQRGNLPESFDLWGGVPAAIEVMRAVKTEFDPHRTLNAGRFVGGI